MFCKSCGKENNEGARFCISCGAPLPCGRMFAENSVMINHDADSLQDVENSQFTEKIGRGIFESKTFLLIILGMILSGALLLGFIVYQKMKTPTIDLEDYITIETEGYDGYGTVHCEIDWNKMKVEHNEDVVITEKSGKIMGLVKYFADPFEILKQCVSVTFSQNENLSNGDVVKYSFKAVDGIPDFFGCEMICPEGEFEVSGLKEVEYFDPFDDVTVDFSGISPQGNVSFEYKGEELSSEDFYTDKNQNLRNGDTVTIYVDSNDETYYLENIGMMPSRLSKSYRVKDLPEYAEEYAELDKEFIEKITSQAEDIICSYAAKNYITSSALGELRYEGYFMNTAKELDRTPNEQNSLILLLSGCVSNSQGLFRATRVYFPVMFVNIVTGDETNYEYDNGILGTSYLDGTQYKTSGYSNPIICYNSLKNAYESDYKMVCGDGFDKYSVYEPVSRLSDVGVACRTSLRNEVEDKLESYLSSIFSRDDYYIIKNVEYMGEYLLTAKSQSLDFKSSNTYFVVFEVTLGYVRDGSERTIYMPAAYYGIGNLPDNEFFVTESGDINGSVDTLGWGIWWLQHIKGYTDGTKMFREIITTNRNNYTYDISAGLRQFGE